MNKKIYKGYELIKALADEDIEAGTILIFTSTIDTKNKIEVEVARKQQGLVLYKRNTIDDILPSSWLLNSKIEVLEDNTEEQEYLGESWEEVGKRVGEWAKEFEQGFKESFTEIVTCPFKKLEDNTEEIEELDTLNAYKLMESPYMVKLLKEQRYDEFMGHLRQSEVEIANKIMEAEDKINELVKSVKKLDKDINYIDN